MTRRRNPVIADIFSRMNYMERRGSGFKKINADYRLSINYTEELAPKYYSDNSSFKVTLYNLNYNVPIEKNDGKKIKNDGINDGIKLNSTQTKIIKLLKDNSQHTIDSLSENVGVKHRAIERNLKVLKDNGYIERIGTRKVGEWIVKMSI